MSSLSSGFTTPLPFFARSLAFALLVAWIPVQGEDQPADEQSQQETQMDAQQDMSEEDMEGEDADAEEEKPKAETSYVALEPEFTINYGRDKRRLRYLQTTISLEVSSNEAAMAVNEHSDAIRHEVIMLISQQSGEEVRSAQSRQKLQDELLQRLQALMKRETNKPLIENVLFTSFVVQG